MSKEECVKNSSDVIIDLIKNEKETGNLKEVAMMETRLCRKSKKRYSLDFLNTPEKAALLGKRLFKEYLDREMVFAVGITAKCEPISVQLISIGTMDASLIDMRCLFRFAILSGAHSILLFHNHLSMIPSPSKEDISITKRVKEVGNLVGIQLRDHLIIVGNDYCSMIEGGFI